MIQWLQRLLFRTRGMQSSMEELEALRVLFKKRYWNFQRLLAANSKALRLMTHLEEALDGERQVSMSFIRATGTTLATTVFQIIRHMDSIAPDKYQPLFTQFKRIQTEMGEVLTHRTKEEEGPLAVPIHDARFQEAELVGDKMASLGELGTISGAHIPTGFVITTRGYRLFIAENGLRNEINRIIQSSEGVESWQEISDRIQRLVMAAPVPAALEEALLTNYDKWIAGEGRPPRVAVRSSAIGEDGKTMSFAGQYRTVLDVERSDLPTAYKSVVAGKYNARAMSYRIHHGIPDDDVPMCVGCMPMVPAICGGVVYTRNPLDSSDDTVSIYLVEGMPNQVVDGTADVSVFSLSRGADGPVLKGELHTSSCDCIKEKDLLSLATLSIQIESHFGTGQDIEWAKSDKGLFLLQSRPLTWRAGSPAPSPKPVDVGGRIPLLTGGVTASRGTAFGPVFITHSAKDAVAFPDGGVLVIDAPLPYYATLLYRASAVISERGNVACHLANVAREYGVPALFQVPDAMALLGPGREVTVDADRQQIYDGRVEPLLEEGVIPERSPIDTPVHRALRHVSELIVPLHLVDPDSPSFSPENCRTMHDITRFCHEKAVSEISSFGAEHHFPERASRRLYKDGATQFWIIDLDDGLKKGSDDPRWVRFEDIVSIPTLAIWRGMGARAWEGPPPVDARGFFQVVAASTMDTNLNTAMPSQYAAGSHFMISRTYCSLQARFGYHFATVEALVGERYLENYISFEFKGGGAGQKRKDRRARLVADILEEHGFQAVCNRDVVTAKLGGFDSARMEKALEVIGYLLVHTRQVDMVMADAAALEKYKTAMRRDLESLVGGEPEGGD